MTRKDFLKLVSLIPLAGVVGTDGPFNPLGDTSEETLTFNGYPINLDYKNPIPLAFNIQDMGHIGNNVYRTHIWWFDKKTRPIVIEQYVDSTMDPQLDWGVPPERARILDVVMGMKKLTLDINHKGS